MNGNVYPKREAEECECCADRLAAEQEAEQEAEEDSDFFNHAVELVRGQK